MKEIFPEAQHIVRELRDQKSGTRPGENLSGLYGIRLGVSVDSFVKFSLKNGRFRQIR